MISWLCRLHIYPHMHVHVRSSLKLKRESKGKAKSLANVITLRTVNAQSECIACKNSDAIGTYKDKKPKGRYLASWGGWKVDWLWSDNVICERKRHEPRDGLNFKSFSLPSSSPLSLSLFIHDALRPEDEKPEGNLYFLTRQVFRETAWSSHTWEFRRLLVTLQPEIKRRSLFVHAVAYGEVAY